MLCTYSVDRVSFFMRKVSDQQSAVVSAAVFGGSCRQRLVCNRCQYASTTLPKVGVCIRTSSVSNSSVCRRMVSGVLGWSGIRAGLPWGDDDRLFFTFGTLLVFHSKSHCECEFSARAMPTTPHQKKKIKPVKSTRKYSQWYGSMVG